MNQSGKTIRNVFDISYKMILYSFKIIFAGKFIYFLVAAIAFYFFVTGINLFSNSNFSEEDVYYLLFFPGLLLIFYPTSYGIQNDFDSGMLEILFGIPNYRYKVWLIRILLIFVLVFLILLILAFLTHIALVEIEIFEMCLQLMYPVVALGSMSFMCSTLIRNGNGTAVVMIIIGMLFWIIGGSLDLKAWNIYLNPYDLPSDVNENLWDQIVRNNRLYLAVASIIFILTGMLNLQKREQFL